MHNDPKPEELPDEALSFYHAKDVGEATDVLLPLCLFRKEFFICQKIFKATKRWVLGDKMLDRLSNLLIIGVLFCMMVWVFLFQNTNIAMQKGQDMVLVKDGAGVGSSLYVPADPKRVTMLSSSSINMWVNLGGGEKVTAVGKFSDVEKNIYARLNKDAIYLGAYAYKSIETIVATQPDLVIMSGFENSQNTLGEFLQKENIPLLTMPCRTIEDTYTELRLYGRLIGRQELAEENIARIKKNIQINYEKYKKDNPAKVLLVFGTASSFAMFTPETRQGEMLELAGGVNIVEKNNAPLGSKYVPLSLEYIALKDPDFVFFINHGRADVMEKKTREALAENSAWNTIRAVKEGRVYVLDPALYITNPGLKTDYAIKYLSEILYSGEK